MAIAINDTYQWRVLYQDGSQVDEFDDARPDGRGWAEKQDGLIAILALVGSSWPGYSIAIPDGATPVFFRRRSITVDPIIGTQSRTTVHCIGWEQDGRGVYLFVFNDGSCLLSADKQAV